MTSCVWPSVCRGGGGGIDLVLGRIDPLRLPPDLAHKVLYHEETAVICGAQNSMATCPPDQLSERMAAAEWILPTITIGASRLVATWLVNRGHNPPRITVESISPLAIVGLLSKTDLLGILPLCVMLSFNHFCQLSTLCDGLALTRAEGASA
ncbi:LysR substrate-binding domain-containing protein [Sulfitobacter sp.]|uniref:LysR substrate-binding domain-containing protein n=1 Tax=Sulfitobacter sp. TaxID=1903071 RepID=UPI0030016DBE